MSPAPRGSSPPVNSGGGYLFLLLAHSRSLCELFPPLSALSGRRRRLADCWLQSIGAPLRHFCRSTGRERPTKQQLAAPLGRHSKPAHFRSLWDKNSSNRSASRAQVAARNCALAPIQLRLSPPADQTRLDLAARNCPAGQLARPLARSQVAGQTRPLVVVCQLAEMARGQLIVHRKHWPDVEGKKEKTSNNFGQVIDVDTFPVSLSLSLSLSCHSELGHFLLCSRRCLVPAKATSSHSTAQHSKAQSAGRPIDCGAHCASQALSNLLKVPTKQLHSNSSKLASLTVFPALRIRLLALAARRGSHLLGHLLGALSLGSTSF